ncbi:hypothetical protein K6H11_002646 [Candida tropicalis]
MRISKILPVTGVLSLSLGFWIPTIPKRDYSSNPESIQIKHKDVHSAESTLIEAEPTTSGTVANIETVQLSSVSPGLANSPNIGSAAAHSPNVGTAVVVSYPTSSIC